MKLITLLSLFIFYAQAANSSSFAKLNSEQPQIDEEELLKQEAIELESVLISRGYIIIGILIFECSNYLIISRKQ